MKVLNKDTSRLPLEFDELEVWNPDYSDWLDLDPEDGTYETVDGGRDVPFDDVVSYYELVFDDPTTHEGEYPLPHGIQRDEIRNWVIEQIQLGLIPRPSEPKYIMYI
jgi:hypothetical protein